MTTEQRVLQHFDKQAVQRTCSLSRAHVATYRGAQQHHFGITGCGTGAGGLDAPFWHPVEQQEEEAPCTQYPEAHKCQPPMTQTVALQLLKDVRRNRIMVCSVRQECVKAQMTANDKKKRKKVIPSPPPPPC